MLSRRSVVTFLACGCGVSPSAQAAIPRPDGCCLIGWGIVAAGLRSYGVARLGGESPQMVTTSGDRRVDRELGRALLRLGATFEANPGCAFFDDEDQPNAMALTANEVPRTRGTVLFGQSLFQEAMGSDDDGMSVMAVFAHEFGHIAQFNTGMHNRLSAGYPTQKLVELHADFLAGYYLGLRKSEHPDLRLWSAGALIHHLGDNNFTAPNHHGTPQERTAAIEAGHQLGRGGQVDIVSAMASGADFVRRFA